MSNSCISIISSDYLQKFLTYKGRSGHWIVTRASCINCTTTVDRLCLGLCRRPAAGAGAFYQHVGSRSISPLTDTSSYSQGDELLALAEDDDTYEAAAAPAPARPGSCPAWTVSSKPERLLFVGWFGAAHPCHSANHLHLQTVLQTVFATLLSAAATTAAAGRSQRAIPAGSITCATWSPDPAAGVATGGGIWTT